jgi:hypothetical protein
MSRASAMMGRRAPWVVNQHVGPEVSRDPRRPDDDAAHGRQDHCLVVAHGRPWRHSVGFNHLGKADTETVDVDVPGADTAVIGHGDSHLVPLRRGPTSERDEGLDVTAGPSRDQEQLHPTIISCRTCLASTAVGDLLWPCWACRLWSEWVRHRRCPDQPRLQLPRMSSGNC